jgi:hypothetical protein
MTTIQDKIVPWDVIAAKDGKQVTLVCYARDGRDAMQLAIVAGYTVHSVGTYNPPPIVMSGRDAPVQ